MTTKGFSLEDLRGTGLTWRYLGKNRLLNDTRLMALFQEIPGYLVR